MKKLLVFLTTLLTLVTNASEISIMGLKLNSKAATYTLPCAAAYVATSFSGIKNNMSIAMGICAASVTTTYLANKKEDDTQERINTFIAEARRDINDNHRIMRELYSRYQYAIKVAVEKVILELKDEIPSQVKNELHGESFKKNLRASTIRVLAKKLKEERGDIDEKIRSLKKEVIKEVARDVLRIVTERKKNN